MTGFSIRFRVIAAAVVLAAAASLAVSQTHAAPAKPREPWRTGFWLWAGETPAAALSTPDILYIEPSGNRWPHGIPSASEYVIVQRLEPDAALTAAVATATVDRFKKLVADADASGARVTGLQIDFDCPTRSLASYGRFLARVHAQLPTGRILSTTALLDWFMPGTDVARALAPVDEFVPQFYDTMHDRTSAGIAQAIDAARWAPIFNRYGVPYRIGISSFGRIARRRPEESGGIAVHYFRDASPLDFSGRQEFVRSARATPAGEVVVHYDIPSPPTDRPELRPGDTLDITFPTDASVRTAWEAARRFGGYNAGVIFFRWPGRSETVTLMPDDVLRAVAGEALSTEARLDVRQAACIARDCTDLYLNLGASVNGADRIVAIRALGAFDTFLPGGPLHPRASGAHGIFVRVPAYAGVGSVYLGRTISARAPGFELLQTAP